MRRIDWNRCCLRRFNTQTHTHLNHFHSTKEEWKRHRTNNLFAECTQNSRLQQQKNNHFGFILLFVSVFVYCWLILFVSYANIIFLSFLRKYLWNGWFIGGCCHSWWLEGKKHFAGPIILQQICETPQWIQRKKSDHNHNLSVKMTMLKLF